MQKALSAEKLQLEATFLQATLTYITPFGISMEESQTERKTY